MQTYMSHAGCHLFVAEEASTLFLGGEPTIYVYKRRNEMLKLFFCIFPLSALFPRRIAMREFRI